MNGRSRIGSAWRGLLPVGVAAGMALVIGGGVDAVHHRQRAAKTEHAAKPAAKSEQTASRFLVGVRQAGTALLVRDLKGADVGLPIAAPRGARFRHVSALKGGTFVVAASTGRQVTFQRLKLDAKGRPKALQPLPKATLSGVSTAYSDLAAGPDGDRIAYVTYRGAKSRVDVVSTRTGARKSWTTKGPAHVAGLSWAGDTLAFVWSPLHHVHGRVAEAKHQVRALDTRLPSGDLKASKPVLNLPKGASEAVLTRDGRTVIAGLAQDGQITLQGYAVATRKPTKIFARQRVAGKRPALRVSRLDIDHTGRHLLAALTDGRLLADGAVLTAPDLADAAW
ncbi:hypothetical protein AGRA3207_004605 [Actinomadura graeca]|uniref:WD40 repeat domain-containing protein n=1 Tax=Actinomadura graeca TaxID=2750812 RepID=A0ABX8QZL6_9ACTN|nr:hypothetical protein [Actinomadura graeca]QXJ23454.1 hypothetical protein AGRA3207_004605 [Actinomadura graeca]